MKKNIRFLIVLLTSFLIFISLFILFIQGSMFFHPWHDELSYDRLKLLEDFEEININNNSLRGWIKYNSKEQKAPLVIFFGGNAQNTSNNCLYFSNNNLFSYFEGYNFMSVDYPGYGLSKGSPSEKSMFKMALNVYDYASNLEFVDKNNIVIMGYSIGTGVATYLASQRNVNGLVLVAPYDNALSLYNDTLNIFHGPLKALALFKFDSTYYATKVKVPTLIISSYDDEVIHYSLAVNLAKYFGEHAQTLVFVNNVTHNTYFTDETVFSKIHEYLKERK